MTATDFHTKAFKYVQTYNHTFFKSFLKIEELRTKLPLGSGLLTLKCDTGLEY